MKKYINLFFAVFLVSCFFLLAIGQAPSIKPIYTKLNDIFDVNITSILDNQALTYDSTSGKWINETVQAYDAELTAIAALAVTDGNFIVGNGSTWVAESGVTVRTSIGLGSVENTALSTWVGTGNITTVGTLSSGNADAVVSAASTTTAGKSELATTAEVNTGTDTGRTVTPDALAGSVFGEKTYCLCIFESAVSVTVGDGGVAFTIPASMNGMDLVDVVASVHTQGVTGTTDVQIRRRRAGSDVDMLSTKITIAAEFFASDETINASNDDVATGDQIYIDVDAIHTTPPTGLSVTLTFRLP